MMWWSVWCVAMVACSVCVAAPASSGLSPIDWREVDEDMYDVAPLNARIAGAPWMYFIGEEPHDSQDGRAKRRMPTLSIDMPMSLLRQKLNLEKERKEHAMQAVANRNFLNDIGKRDLWGSSAEHETYN